MMRNRGGFTLVELSMSIGIGMLVAIAAFAAIDASSKTIARSKQASLEVDMVSSAIRWIRSEPSSSAKISGLSSVRDYDAYILDVAAGSWPDHWPILKMQRINTLINPIGGGLRGLYQLTLQSKDGVVMASYVLPITSLP